MAKLGYGKSPVEPSFWFLKAALYHSEDYNFKDEHNTGLAKLRDNILSVIFPKITIDVYCPSCKRETVFNPLERKIDWFSPPNVMIIKNGVHYAHFFCSRRHCGSSLFFVFHLDKGILTKIGQFPSIADLISPELKKYGAVLDSRLISDWQRAVGLRSHGIGAGSYVYLRRIIENMVNDASEIALKDGKIQKEEYSKSRWPEKIKMLSEYLPSYLVENAKVYSVLSKGVHELSEEECSDFFPVIHTSIEIICEEKLSDLERNKKAESGAKALQKVLQKISEKDA